MRRLGWLPAFAILFLSGNATALDQKDHYEQALAGCTEAALPADFCERVAVEAFNVDKWEFWDLISHAQMDGADAVCSSATSVLDRTAELGVGMGDGLRAGDAEASASSLGRLLHLVHDNCAHHGVGNPEHAWYSLQDVCEGTSNSPDKEPGAMPCAQQETAFVMSAFVDAMAVAGTTQSDLTGVEELGTKKAGWMDKCDFLAEAETWDGRSISWDRDTVRGMMQQALLNGLDGAHVSQDACAGDPSTIAPAPTNADVDVSEGTPSCLKVHLYCLGKADDPFETDGEPAPAPAEPTTSSASESGCQFGASTPHPLGALLLFGFGIGLLARRRRAH